MGVELPMKTPPERLRRIAKWLARTWIILFVLTCVFLGAAVAFPGEMLHFGWSGVIGMVVIALLAETTVTLPLLVAAAILDRVAKRRDQSHVSGH